MPGTPTFCGGTARRRLTSCEVHASQVFTHSGGLGLPTKRVVTKRAELFGSVVDEGTACVVLVEV